MQKIRTRFKDLRQMCISIWPNKYHSFNYILDCLGLSEWMCNTIFHSEGEDGNFEDENLVEIYLLIHIFSEKVCNLEICKLPIIDVTSNSKVFCSGKVLIWYSADDSIHQKKEDLERKLFKSWGIDGIFKIQGIAY